MNDHNLPPLFICGAGISMAPPASLPDASGIVNAALTHLLPKNTLREELYCDLIRRIQPEVLFEQTSFLIGPQVLGIWNVLNTSYAQPNIYHYLLVFLASQYQTPIITLNFDTLLEKAAENLGFSKPNIQVYIPSLPGRAEFLTSAAVSPEKCRLWKVHGSIETIMQTTMSQIARPNQKLLAALEQLLTRCRAYLVGYSGRDGDFFPELAQRIRRASLPQSKLPVWIDPFAFANRRDAATRLGVSTWDRAKILDRDHPECIGQSTDLVATVEAAFPFALDEIRKKIPRGDFLLRLTKLFLDLGKKNIALRQELKTFVTQDTTVDIALKRLSKNRAVAELMSESGDAFRALIECELHCIKHCVAIEQTAFSKISLDRLTKEALLVCLLFHSGYMREAYDYGKPRMKQFESGLPPNLASIVSLYFARICDWNSQYETFLQFTSKAKLLANAMPPEEHRTRLMVQAGVECLTTRAKSMLLGPVMNWPDQNFKFRLSLKQKFYLYKTCFITSFRIRAMLAQFEGASKATVLWRTFFPKPPRSGGSETILEEVAWQYYLDHRQVFLNYIVRMLRPLIKLKPPNQFLAPFITFVNRLAVRTARIALWKLTRLVRRAGAATIQADIYLFRTRYGIGQDLEFSEHFWSLVSNPVGRALVVRDRGEALLESGHRAEAKKEFKRCYLLSARCGSHSTALKALIGLFHVDHHFREALWRKHIDALEGNVYVNFFNSRTRYIAESGKFKQQ